MTHPDKPMASRITQLREAAGLSKAALAKRIGTSDVTVGYWESGEIKSIRHGHLLRLAQAFGITVSELLEDPMLPDYRARILMEAESERETEEY